MVGFCVQNMACWLDLSVLGMSNGRRLANCPSRKRGLARGGGKREKMGNLTEIFIEYILDRRRVVLMEAANSLIILRTVSRTTRTTDCAYKGQLAVHKGPEHSSRSVVPHVFSFFLLHLRPPPVPHQPCLASADLHSLATQHPRQAVLPFKLPRPIVTRKHDNAAIYTPPLPPSRVSLRLR